MCPPDLQNPLEDLLGYRLRRASAGLMTKLAHDLDQLGLSPTEASVLLLIAANARITQSQIGRVLGIKRANMAPLTALLEKRRLLLREPVNGRSQGLTVTPAGAALAVQASHAMVAQDARLLARLDDRTFAAVKIALALLRDPDPGEPA